ncbi:MAG: thioredoxin family protein [Bacteroidia bacterium]|nr:thioredoxin family protein [Bacteroidia bacterium]
MKCFPRYFILASLIGLMSCTPKEKIVKPDYIPKIHSEFHFHTQALLADILDEAKKENKGVFLDIYTDWCLPCKMMDEEVFSDKDLGKYYRDNFICYKVDAEKANGPDLVFLYDVQVYPTLLFLDHNGRVLIRKKGAAFQSEMYDLADEAMSLFPE